MMNPPKNKTKSKKEQKKKKKASGSFRGLWSWLFWFEWAGHPIGSELLRRVWRLHGSWCVRTFQGDGCRWGGQSSMMRVSWSWRKVIESVIRENQSSGPLGLTETGRRILKRQCNDGQSTSLFVIWSFVYTFTLTSLSFFPGIRILRKHTILSVDQWIGGSNKAYRMSVSGMYLRHRKDVWSAVSPLRRSR